MGAQPNGLKEVNVSMAVKTIMMLAILIVGIIFLSALFIRDKQKMVKRERHDGKK